MFIDCLAKGNIPASHIPEANIWEDLVDRLLDWSVTDQLMDGVLIGL